MAQKRRRRESRAARRRRIMRNRLMALGALVVVIIIVIVIIVSCSANKGDKADTKKTDTTNVEQMTDENGEVVEGDALEEGEETVAAKTANEKPIQLYTVDYSTMTCTKATNISKNWTPSEDLCSLGAFVETENSFEFQSESVAYRERWEKVNTATDYKIGYELSFDVDGETKVITILKPGDIESNPDLYNGDYPDGGDYSGITGYLGVWVYDDMNQEEGAFYIHITQSEVTDKTLLTSIKLRPTPQSDAISNVSIKGFSYSSNDEFDTDGHYTGDYASVVTFSK